MGMLRQFIKAIVLAINPLRDKGHGNVVSIQCKIRRGFVAVYGNNNVIEVASDCTWADCEVVMQGDNNRLIIDPKARLLGPVRILMEGNATLHLGENCGVRGVDFKIKNGTVTVGKLAMFSYGIKVRNHDSHRVFMQGESEPCNSPADVVIGNHTWICQDASILKGVSIGDDSIVAFGAVATRSCPPNSILAGNPAKIVKTGITWDY